MPMRGDREPRLMQGNHGSGGGFVRRNHATYILRRVLLVVILLLLAFAVTRTCQSFAAFDDSGSRDNDNAIKEEAVQKEPSEAPGGSGKGDLGNITPGSPLDEPEKFSETDGAKESAGGGGSGDKSQDTEGGRGINQKDSGSFNESGSSTQESSASLGESAVEVGTGLQSASAAVVEEFPTDPDAGIVAAAVPNASSDLAAESVVAVPIIQEPQVSVVPLAKNKRRDSAGKLASTAVPNADVLSGQDPTAVVPVPLPTDIEDVPTKRRNVSRQASTGANAIAVEETETTTPTVPVDEELIAEAEPVVEAEPIAEAETVVEPEPVVEEQVVEVEPVVEPEPVIEDDVVVAANGDGGASGTVSGGQAEATAGEATAIVDESGAIAVAGGVEASVGPDGPKVKIGKGKVGKRNKRGKIKKFKDALVSAEEIIAATEAATP